jgi:hypothetical protein
MPIKGAIIQYLDGISEASRETGAVNTIVKVPSSTNASAHQLIGVSSSLSLISLLSIQTYTDEYRYSRREERFAVLPSPTAPRFDGLHCWQVPQRG